MPYRASLRHDSGPRSEFTSGKRFSSGTRTSRSTSSDVTDARSDIFLCISGASKPFMPRSTRKPLISPSSVRAQTTATSAIVPFVIHIFDPLRIQSEPLRFAVVRIEPGSDPASGSVRPKQPIASPVCSGGSQRCFCSSEPQRQIANIASEPWTETKLRTPESPASSSMQVKPYMTELAPGRPYPSRCIPNRPSRPNS